MGLARAASLPPHSIGCPLPHLWPSLTPSNRHPSFPSLPNTFTAHLSQEKDLLIALSVSNPSQSTAMDETG